MLHYDEQDYEDRDLDTPINDHTDEDDHPYDDEDQDEDGEKEEDEPDDVKYEEELANMDPEDLPESYQHLHRE